MSRLSHAAAGQASGHTWQYEESTPTWWVSSVCSACSTTSAVRSGTSVPTMATRRCPAANACRSACAMRAPRSACCNCGWRTRSACRGGGSQWLSFKRGWRTVSCCWLRVHMPLPPSARTTPSGASHAAISASSSGRAKNTYLATPSPSLHVGTSVYQRTDCRLATPCARLQHTAAGGSGTMSGGVASTCPARRSRSPRIAGRIQPLHRLPRRPPAAS